MMILNVNLSTVCIFNNMIKLCIYIFECISQSNLESCMVNIVASACSWKTLSCLRRRNSSGFTTPCLLWAPSSFRWILFDFPSSMFCRVQIGEVGQQFSGKNLIAGSSERGELPAGLVSLQEVVQLGGGDEEVASKNGKREDLLEGEGWSITFEQFYASILTEPSLVDNFSQRTDIEVR